MQSVFFRSHSNQLRPFYYFTDDDNSIDLIQSFKEEVFEAWGIPVEEQTLFHNGRIIQNKKGLDSLGRGAIVDVSLKLQGGKGGFGSLLRGMAKSNKKITNFDASRDLQGRRIRNVKLHQKIIDWAKQKKKEEKDVKKEVDEFNKAQKEIQGVQRDIRLTQEFKDKVEKWDYEMSSSIRAGAKKIKKPENKREYDDLELNDFEEPKRRKKFITEDKKVNKTAESSSEIDSKISKLIAVLKDETNKTSGTEANGTIEKKEEEKPIEELNNGKLKENKIEVKEFSPLDLSTVETVDDLIKLGNDHLKHELMRLGLKCGGTLQDKAKRLHDIKLKPQLLLDPKYIAKK